MRRATASSRRRWTLRTLRTRSTTRYVDASPALFRFFVSSVLQWPFPLPNCTIAPQAWSNMVSPLPPSACASACDMDTMVCLAGPSQPAAFNYSALCDTPRRSRARRSTNHGQRPRRSESDDECETCISWPGRRINWRRGRRRCLTADVGAIVARSLVRIVGHGKLPSSSGSCNCGPTAGGSGVLLWRPRRIAHRQRSRLALPGVALR